MLKRVDAEEWVKFLDIVSEYSIFDSIEWVENIENTFQLQSIFYIFFQDNKPILGFICYVSGDWIKLPNHVFFSSLVFNKKHSENVISDNLTASIKELSSKYKVINFKFNPEIKDIRSFTWNQFNVIPRYTYWVDLLNTKYHERVYRVLKKEHMRNYTYYENKDNELNLDRQFDFVPKSEKSMNHFYTRKFIEKMIVLKKIIVFSAYENETLNASYVVIKDDLSKIAYGIMLYTVPEFAKTGVTSGLHDFVFNYMRDKGIQNFDLCGGNFQQISAFKRGFNPVLKLYFETTKDNRFGNGKIGELLVNTRNSIKKFTK